LRIEASLPLFHWRGKTDFSLLNYS
jgi:hypothetical protein